ncbi:hypothetical protein GWI33_008153 [Rhynchophorus ferrugineus]|uniref:Multidrug resistance-associated protein lethal(2)03659 n=1 Tax=Rhynchophorus ferrugineus TaxID=354439 RepID=A0A834IIR5_RHYFE|nr:hypothetical protein GWI33_008153 [Rhynchophorus ferrugineus]
MYIGYKSVSKQNPRETAGILSFLTFGYTLELFKKGLKGGLTENDIYEIPDNCESKKCALKTENAWKECNEIFPLLWKRFGKTYLMYSSIHLTWLLINSCIRPYAMSRFISYFDKSQSSYTKQDAYYYGGIVISLSVIRCVWIHNYFMLECILGLQVRTSISSLVYRKILKLSPQIGNAKLGNLVTILTKDIRSIVDNMWPMSDLFIGSIQLTVSSFLLYMKMGYPALLGIVILLSTIVIQALLSRTLMRMRLKVGKMADTRLEMTKETVASLKMIKMYTWEDFFQKRICDARKKEMRVTLKAWYLGVILVNMGWLVAKMSFPTLILIYLRLGYTIDTEFLFYVLSLYKDLGHVIGAVIPTGFRFTAELYASVKRIGRVLSLEEFEKQPPRSLVGNPRLELKQVSIVTRQDTILKNISFTIDEPGLYVLTGPLGSGKSTLLKVLMEDCIGVSGSVMINGRVSYVSQEPWLFPTTIRRNILFAEVFDKVRYERVMSVCCLNQDLNSMADRDNTVVADGGLNLSRGQQARINLARGIYRNSDIYLLDDPLSGLDVRVQQDIINNCLKTFLKDKIVIFVTNNMDHCEHAKKVLVLQSGCITMCDNVKATPQCRLDGGCDIVDVERKDPSNYWREEISQNIYREENNLGGVNLKNYIRYVRYAGGFLLFGVIVGIFVVSQFTESYSEKLLSNWVDRQHNTSHNSVQKQVSNERDQLFNLYLIVITCSAALDLIKSYVFLGYCRRAAIKFHNIMCNRIINCRVSFLDTHFIGNILNRFSYDLDNIDEVFPMFFMNIIKASLSVVGVLLLIFSVNWLFLLMSSLVIIVMIVLRMLYIPGARGLKRLSASTRSPLLGHINASLDGLATIRAFQAQEILTKDYDQHQNTNTSANYMETTTSRAFGFIMDTTGAMFVVMVIITFLFIDTDNTVGNVGLAVSQVFQLSDTCLWFIRAWAELEQCMTSVERVVEYSEVPKEENNDTTPHGRWGVGKVEYKMVNLSYRAKHPILKGVTFVIRPRERIGIVGRTGAGKSSIISTLFRLYDYQGDILIDNVNTSTLPLRYLRSHLSIIPQNPLIFKGTLRVNVDPLERYQDDEIWQVLDHVKLKHLVPTLDVPLKNLKLSTGQCQLLCLARTFLAKNDIVIFDEPTASLDATTDEVIQKLIDNSFTDSTLIMIAHRLDTVMKCDKVMVIADGRVCEFDHPDVLLRNENGIFRSMIETNSVHCR